MADAEAANDTRLENKTGSESETLEFPRAALLALLGEARETFETEAAQEELLKSLGLTQSTLRPESAAASTSSARTLSARSFANALIDFLEGEAKFDLALTLARRIFNALDTTTSFPISGLLTALEAMRLAHRTRQLAGGDSPDLDTYKQWMGFECLHTYSLTDRFFGRTAQLQELNDWISAREKAASVKCIAALGGGGKTALAWHWLSGAQNSIRQLGYRGIFWCSFYEKDFDFGAFLRRALAFSGGMTQEVVEGLPRSEIERRLLQVMLEEPFLFIVDGLERLMNGYAIVFDRAVDAESVKSGKKEHQVTAYDRRLTDPRSGTFLLALTEAIASRVLITTRLIPAELQKDPAREHPEMVPNVDLLELGGLDPESAHALWASIVTNAVIPAGLQAIFAIAGFHPLVISILARSVARCGGDWETWLAMPTHKDFAPRKEDPEAEIRAQIIGVCIRDLDEFAYDVLGVLTTSGKPMPFKTISQILMLGSAASGDGRWRSESQVQAILDSLVELGFVGAAVQSDFVEYDVHPVVRGAAWNLVTDPNLESFLTHALSEFYATPDRIESKDGVAALTKASTYFKLLAQTGEYDRAWEMYYNKLWPRLTLDNANRELFDLFALLLPGGDPLQLVPLRMRHEQGSATLLLGNLLMSAGDVKRADRLLRWCGAIRLQLGDALGFLNARHERTWQTMYQGHLFETELDLRTMKIDAMHFNAYQIGPALDCWIGIILALRGEPEEARRKFDAAEGQTESFRWWAQGLAEGYVYLEEPARALEWINKAIEARAQEANIGGMQEAWEELTRGMAHFQQRDFDAALDDLSSAMGKALRANYAVIQRFAYPCIAEIFLEQGDRPRAEAQIGDYFRVDPHSEYQLCATDAWRVLALCHLDRGNVIQARQCAVEAYRLAACDGPPFVYAKGLDRARKVLEKCGDYLPRTVARLDPAWAERLASLPEPSAEALLDVGQEGETEQRRVIIRSVEEARAYLEQMAIMREAAEKDRLWWAEVTRNTHSAIKLPLTHAMEERGITLERFRHAYEVSPYKSLDVVFHQLHAERIIAPLPPRPVSDLDDEALSNWLKDVASHRRALAYFLTTPRADNAAVIFQMQEFDKVGVSAFLNDDKRRIAYEGDKIAKQWWDQLEAVCEPMAMLILAECILQTGNTLSTLFGAIAVETEKGIEYAFASLMVTRAIERLEVKAISKTEGWSPVQIFLRLEDVKHQLGWAEVSDEVRSFWTLIENKNQHDAARVLQLAEELALRKATLTDYHWAYLHTDTDNIQALLAHLDYAACKDEPWTNGSNWPEAGLTTLAITGASSPTFTDAEKWTAERINNRIAALKTKLGWEDANEAARNWWLSMSERFEPATVLRLAEELDVRRATISDIYLAHVDGATENLKAALGYLDFTILKKSEEAKAMEGARRLNASGNELYEAGKYEAAIEKYKAAIESAPAPADWWLFTNLANAWEHVSSVDRPARVENALAAIDLGIARGVASERLEKERKTLSLKKRVWDRLGYPDGSPMLPVVTPIAIEAAMDIAPFFDTGAQPPTPFLTGLEAMREDMRATTGVRIPGVRFRGNETDMPEGTYLIMLDEIPLVMGTVSLDRYLVLRSEEELEKFGVRGESAVDPMDSRNASWITKEDAKKLPDVSFGPDGYILRHLEAVLRKNLVLFSGHQEVVNRLEEAWGAAAQRILKDEGRVSTLTRLIRAMLIEEVPTRPFTELCEAFEDGVNAGCGLDDLLITARALVGVRSALQGNQPECRLLRLGKRFEATIAQGLDPLGDEHMLLLKPEITQAMLAVVRDEVSDLEGPKAVVVVRPIIRRYVRKLVELEFPALSVISEDELIGDWQTRV